MERCELGEFSDREPDMVSREDANTVRVDGERSVFFRSLLDGDFDNCNIDLIVQGVQDKMRERVEIPVDTEFIY